MIVIDMVRCILKVKNMSKSFWVEAVSYAIYLLNRCPTRNVLEKTPEEVWSGRRPFVGHLRVFGCIAYSYIPDQLRKKLDDEGEKCDDPTSP